jgi:hypothetical protein
MTPMVGKGLTRGGVALDVHLRELRKTEPARGDREQQEMEMTRIELRIDVAALLAAA